MILNVGARTDIVNYYGDWLLERFREGYVYTRNPLFPNRVTNYTLSPDKVDAVLFCSKNYAPMLDKLSAITDHYRTYFHYTITAYGKDVEPNVPDLPTSVQTLKAPLASSGGRNLHGGTTPFSSRPPIPSVGIWKHLKCCAGSLRPMFRAAYSASSRCMRNCNTICPS